MVWLKLLDPLHCRFTLFGHHMAVPEVSTVSALLPFDPLWASEKVADVSHDDAWVTGRPICR
jgi:hypothetical protein